MYNKCIYMYKIYMYVCKYVFMYVCMCVCMLACMYVYVCVCIYAYLYISDKKYVRLKTSCVLYHLLLSVCLLRI